MMKEYFHYLHVMFIYQIYINLSLNSLKIINNQIILQLLIELDIQSVIVFSLYSPNFSKRSPQQKTEHPSHCSSVQESDW